MGWVWKERAAGGAVGKTAVSVLVWRVDGLRIGRSPQVHLVGVMMGKKGCGVSHHGDKQRVFLECEFEMWSLLRRSGGIEEFLGLQKAPWSI